MNSKKIKSALISVFSKNGLDPILELLNKNEVQIYSTGGTADYITAKGIKVTRVEDITGYPSILDGRVKTLHPAVFGGILAKREADHLNTLSEYDIPTIDCVIVDLYPFEDTVLQGNSEREIIEKIDIGGVSLIRAAAKNYKELVVVPSKSSYTHFISMLNHSGPITTEDQRKELALKAFEVTTHYDSLIANYFSGRPDSTNTMIDTSVPAKELRYGENPHQMGTFSGRWEDLFSQLSGKELSYNNLLDIDAAVGIMSECRDGWPTVAVIKHNNMCGFSTANNIHDAWKKALSGDPVSAFGGVICSNKKIDLITAESIDEIFYEVLIAPDFDPKALELLKSKKKRILLKLNDFPQYLKNIRTCLNGHLIQDADTYIHDTANWKLATEKEANERVLKDLYFANRLVKHLKSNAIALVKGEVLLGMGAGGPSRVDALLHAIKKAEDNGFDLNEAVMASDAFFPFKDCVEIAHEVGIQAVVQPGGSIKDKESVDFCNECEMSMYMTGIRHFKH